MNGLYLGHSAKELAWAEERHGVAGLFWIE
jgi:hypothetical protein